VTERLVSWRGLLAGTETPLVRDGVPSFLGVPVARTAGDLQGADVAVIGIPSGAQASPGRRPGQWADYGRAPADARRFSLRYGGYLPELDLDVFEHARLVDYGDAEIAPDDVPRSLDAVDRRVRDALDAGCRIITLGGCVPHASYGVVTALARATAGRVGVLSLDAHGDCVDTVWGRPGTHELGAGTWQARMWEDCPSIDPTRHAEIGMRGPRNLREMVAHYRRRGAHVVPMAEVRRRGMPAVMAEALPRVFAGSARTWFSLDMDVLDIGVLPGWGDEPIGITGWELIHAVQAAGRAGVDVFSFQFVAPDSAPAAALVSYAVVYLVAGWITGGRLRGGAARGTPG
jgi:agmatinase